MKQVLITGHPFALLDREPLRLLEKEGIAYTLNPFGRRLTERELGGMIGPFEAMIASTEPISESVMERAPNLRLIARVGIGLDNVALAAARKRGIAVTYTPNAPSPAVAELVVAQMLSLLRHTSRVDREMRQGDWHRRVGRRLGLMTVGVIGVGRIGRRVIQHLQGWTGLRILANDIRQDEDFRKAFGFTWANLETIYREADIITLHVPLTPPTRQMIGDRELATMREDAILINTARGEIINEASLVAALKERPAFSAAIDVFEHEPYRGELTKLENCVLSPHIGAGTRDCRLRMELEATEEVVRYFKGEPFMSPVPEDEYVMQAEE